MDITLVPDKCQNMLPLLALGRLLSWCRESEFSADRAGLLCCGEPRSAYEAIMRLQHGLRADSPWIDPDKEFDTQAVIRQFRQWQYEPFVKFILDVKRQPLEHPYYQERLAMLKAWVEEGAFRKILERSSTPSGGQLIEVVNIKAFELADEGQTVDPYAIVMDGDRQVLRTRYASSVREAEWSGFKPTDAGVEQPRALQNGQPLFFEIWDRNYVTDTFIGGFVIYPDGRDAKFNDAGESIAEYTGKILWDWKEPQSITRPGYARVQVKFTLRQAETPVASFAGVEPVKYQRTSRLVTLAAAIVIAGGCGDSGSGTAGPIQKNPGQAIQGSPSPIATEKPAAEPKG